jgi:hypothetical protein
MRRLIAAVLFAGATIVMVARPAAAECDGPVPSFRDAVSTAKTILIGDVIHTDSNPYGGDDGRSSRFTLRVAYVLRGEAPRAMRIRDLVLQPCAGLLFVGSGDRIALALQALDFDPPIRVNAPAWIRGAPRHRELGAPETFTLAEVFSLLGRTPPDTATIDPAKEPPTPAGIAVVSALAALLLTAAFTWRSSHRRAE